MSTVAISGSDTTIINNRVFSDFADKDVVKLTFPNDIMAVKTGKNGNSIYALNETGKQCEVELMLIRGSSDDKFMNNLLSQQQGNPAGFPLLIGQFIKKIGDGTGAIARDTYILSGGVFVRQVDAKDNVEGDTDQSVALYKLKFTNAPRVIR